MAVDKFSISSEALLLVGANPISDFAGGSAESIVAANLYEATVSELICQHRWACFKRQEQLSRRAVAPSAKWDAAYALPADCEVIHGLYSNDQTIDFDRYREDVLCDALATETVILEYTYRAPEAYWPGYFASVVRYKLAAVFAVPIADDVDKAKFYETKYLRQYASAKQVESQGRTAQKMPVGGLRRYHGGRP